MEAEALKPAKGQPPKGLGLEMAGQEEEERGTAAGSRGPEQQLTLLQGKLASSLRLSGAADAQRVRGGPVPRPEQPCRLEKPLPSPPVR